MKSRLNGYSLFPDYYDIIGCGWQKRRMCERDAEISDKLNCPPFLSRYSNTGG